MKLIFDHWMRMFEITRRLEGDLLRRDPTSLQEKVEQGMQADYRAAEALMSRAETIILPSSIMLDLVHNIDRIDTRGGIRLPYPYILVQFTHPIPEEEIMQHVETNDIMRSLKMEQDKVQGILLANAEQDKSSFLPPFVFNMINCCILFESTAVNRVAWLGSSRPAQPYWQNSLFREDEMPPTSRDNKYRMIALCYALNLFLNAPNIIVEKQKPDPKINAKRLRKGKPILPEYNTVTIKKVQVTYTQSSRGSGTEHSRMYPVRGHFRQLAQFAEPIWIPNHFRGLKHGTESLIKDVYRVPSKK